MSTFIAHEIDPATKKWLEQEKQEQRERYKKIVAEMEALAKERDKWVADFLQRIQTRGFHVNGDMKLKIPADKVPKANGRKLKVLY